MRILVTGASGFLGGALCRALISQGHHVRAFVRRSSDVSQLPQPENRFEFFYGDVTDFPSLLSAFADCDIVFHAAAVVDPWLPDPSLFFSVNVEGLKNILQAYKETPSVQKIIYTSSFFALGPTDGHVADENQVHHEKFFCTEYERSKAMADKIALRAASEGIPIILLYPGVIYGAGKMTVGNVLARIMVERFNGRLPGYIGKAQMPFCHVDDVAAGHVAAMQRGHVGERYLLTGDNVSIDFIFDKAAQITKTRRPLFYIPLWITYIYGWITVFISRITGKLPFISYPTVVVMRHDWKYSYEKAKAELGYSPRNLEQGLGEMLTWLKSLGLISY